jgi:hypothetical protein
MTDVKQFYRGKKVLVTGAGKGKGINPEHA